MVITNLPMVLCLLMGMILVAMEVFLPGFGLPGIGGIALIAIGVMMIGGQFGALTALAVLMIVIAILAVIVSVLLHQAAKGRGPHTKLFLKEREELHKSDMQVLVGKIGHAVTVLRPSGIGDFDGVRLNVVTEGEFIEKDKTVEIIRVDGSRIVVRPMMDKRAVSA